VKVISCKVVLLLQGAVVFAGCVKSQEGGAKELKELNLKRLHVIQMDVTSDEQVAAAAQYVSRHVPPQGDYTRIFI
jgi:NAD(P)-dependent dehydrogenase (short-subunit alcohol dehydrogenase family)